MSLFTEYEGGGFLSVDGEPVVEFDAVLQIAEELATEATEYPIERGVDVLDSAVRRPLEVNFVAAVTATPLVVDANTPKDRDRVAWESLRSLWQAGSPVTFSTAGDTWENMRVVNISRDRTPDSGPNLLTVSVELRQIQIAQIEIVDVPVQFIAPAVRPSAAAEVDAGRQGTNDANEGQEESGRSRASSALRRLLRGDSDNTEGL